MLETIQGAYQLNGVEDGFNVRVKFKCPHCGKRHTQVVKTGTVPDHVDVESKCGLGSCRVVPYRSLQ